MLLRAERGGQQNRACFHGMCEERDEHGVAKVRGNDVHALGRPDDDDLGYGDSALEEHDRHGKGTATGSRCGRHGGLWAGIEVTMVNTNSVKKEHS